MGWIAFLFFFFQGAGPLACQWTPAREVGRVESPIDEDSGLAISRRYPNRLYHVNDSGDSGRFFTTDLSGRDTRVINVNGFKPHDAEDLAIGQCSPTLDCLFIGDIGDNNRKRQFIEVVVIEEQATFGRQVEPRYRVRLRYPDQPRNAESLAVHPNGDLYLLTKGGIPRLYRLSKDQWMNAKGDPQTLQYVATIDLEKLGGPQAAIDGNLPTGMAISPEGKRVLILTYRNLFELFFDLSQPLPPVGDWKPGENYRRIDVEVLAQQEAITFSPDGRSFFYDTERPLKGPALLMRSDCR